MVPMENSNSTQDLDKRNEERAELVRGLRELAKFLFDHPEVDFPSRLSCSSHFGGVDEQTALQRIAAWKALGFRDEWETPIGRDRGHHGVHVKFGALEMHLTYVEKEHSRPIAWGETPGESDKEFQARINAALEAVAPASEPAPDSEQHAEQNVCDTCGMPVVEVDGQWQHAEPADTAFHLIVFGGAQ